MIPTYMRVLIPSGMILGLQRCSCCGYTEYVAFVNIIEYPFDFECAKCHNSTSQPVGPLTPAITNDHTAWVMCTDTIDAIEKSEVVAALVRES